MIDWGWLLFDIAIVLAFTQFISWLNNWYYSGAKGGFRLINKPPLIDLKKNGFSATSGALSGFTDLTDRGVVKLLGQVDGYTLEIGYSYRTGFLTHPYFRIRVFFDLGDLSSEDLQRQCAENIQQSTFFKWRTDAKLTATYGEEKLSIGRFSRPNSQRLLASAQTLIYELKKLNLRPVGNKQSLV